MYSIKEYYNFTKKIYKDRGLNGAIAEGSSYVYESILRQVNPYIENECEYVLEKDWDVLIILDGCRVDLIEEVSTEYDFINEPPHNTIYSCDSYSKGWLEKNFTGDMYKQNKNRMNDIIYVSGNPFTDDVFDGSEFKDLDQTWQFGWNDEDGYMPPKIITDRAIQKYRKSDCQMIVHYMQPHVPFLGESNLGYEIESKTFGETEGNIEKRTPWELYRDGEINRESLWDSYKNTLRYVLDSVELLLNNINSENVVISADHGNGMGEKGIYGHPRNIPVSEVREVPWIKTKAKNTGNYQPDIYDERDKDFKKDDQLEALGYK